VDKATAVNRTDRPAEPSLPAAHRVEAPPVGDAAGSLLRVWIYVGELTG
jgi:hypothetical protein